MPKLWEIDKRHRHPDDAQSKFERWILEYGGTGALALKLGVHQVTVGTWISRRAMPSLNFCVAILAEAKGRLSLTDIHEATRPW